MHKGGGLAGDAGGAGAVQGPVTDHLAVAILVHGGDGRIRGGFPGVHEGLQTVTLPVQQPEAAAAHAGRVGLHHRQGCRHGDGGVVGIAAFREDLHAGVGGQWVSTRYRVLARPGGLGGDGDQQQQGKQNAHGSSVDGVCLRCRSVAGGAITSVWISRRQRRTYRMLPAEWLPRQGDQG